MKTDIIGLRSLGPGSLSTVPVTEPEPRSADGAAGPDRRPGPVGRESESGRSGGHDFTSEVQDLIMSLSPSPTTEWSRLESDSES